MPVTRGGRQLREPGGVTTAAAAAVLSFACPAVPAPDATSRSTARAPSCRAALRRTLGNEARVVERHAFEPAMHVTPNAVALKDD